jgi:hypothetical protein
VKINLFDEAGFLEPHPGRWQEKVGLINHGAPAGSGPEVGERPILAVLLLVDHPACAAHYLPEYRRICMVGGFARDIRIKPGGVGSDRIAE